MSPVSITFTKEQLKVLNDALVELPFREAAPLIQYINMQIQKHFDCQNDKQAEVIPIQHSHTTHTL